MTDISEQRFTRIGWGRSADGKNIKISGAEITIPDFVATQKSPSARDKTYIGIIRCIKRDESVHDSILDRVSKNQQGKIADKIFGDSSPESIARIRLALAAEPPYTETQLGHRKAIAAWLKIRLTCYMPSLVLPKDSPITKPSCEYHSGFYVFDVDLFQSDAERQRAFDELSQHPAVVALWVTSSGTDYAAIIAGPPASTHAEHRGYFGRIALSLPDYVNRATDSHQHDVNRQRFQSWCTDAQIYHNLDPTPFDDSTMATKEDWLSHNEGERQETFRIRAEARSNRVIQRTAEIRAEQPDISEMEARSLAESETQAIDDGSWAERLDAITHAREYDQELHRNILMAGTYASAHNLDTEIALDDVLEANRAVPPVIGKNAYDDEEVSRTFYDGYNLAERSIESWHTESWDSVLSNYKSELTKANARSGLTKIGQSAAVYATDYESALMNVLDALDSIDSNIERLDATNIFAAGWLRVAPNGNAPDFLVPAEQKPTILVDMDIQRDATKIAEILLAFNSKQSNPIWYRDTVTPPNVLAVLGDRAYPVTDTPSMSLAIGGLMTFARQYGDDKIVPCYPPERLVKAAVAVIARQLPILNGVKTSPFVWGDQLVHHVYLYHEDSGYISRCVPGIKTDLPIKDSLERLDDLIEFPFKEPIDRLNYFGALFGCYLKIQYDGPALFIDKPASQTGATLATDVLNILGTGQWPTKITPAQGKLGIAESEKMLIAAMTTYPSGLTLDNIESVEHKHEDGVFRFPMLANALTSRYIEGRVLQYSRILRVPTNSVQICFTGNNVKLQTDLLNRSLAVRLDSKTQNPAERSGFRYRLPYDADKYKAYWMSAVASIVQCWLDAGSPTKECVSLGAYIAWMESVSGILDLIALPDSSGNPITAQLGENHAKTIARSDTKASQFDALVEVWWEKHQHNQQRAVDIVDIASEFFDLEGTDDSGKARSLSTQLTAYIDRTVTLDSGVEVTLTNKKIKKINHWRLVECTEHPF